MKVKSFSVGMLKGLDVAIERLDEQVRDLGEIKIHSVTDTLYPKELTGAPCGMTLVRVVVYE